MNVFTVCTVAAAIAASAGAPAGDLLTFELQDQHGRWHSHAELDGRPAVVVGADRAGRSASERWAVALRREIERRDAAASIVLLRVADLRAVPPPFRPMARRIVRERYGIALLLDWTGQLAAVYAFHPGRANVLAFDARGRLVGRHVARRTDATTVASMVDRLLDGSVPGERASARLDEDHPLQEDSRP